MTHLIHLIAMEVELTECGETLIRYELPVIVLKGPLADLQAIGEVGYPVGRAVGSARPKSRSHGRTVCP